MSRSALRAMLLAAGLGTRLRPITLHTPKCMVLIDGEPLLGRWLSQLEAVGCEAVLVNTHYMADQVVAYIKSREKCAMNVETVHEPKLLGTAGTLLVNQKFFTDKTGLLIHADNVMEESLDRFLEAHKRRKEGCLMTMLTFNTDTPSSCGIVEVDESQVLRGFHEKIRNPPGNRANGAVYAFDETLLQHLNGMTRPPADFSVDVIPNLKGRIQTWHTVRRYLDIGTPETLSKAQRLYSTLKNQQ